MAKKSRSRGTAKRACFLPVPRFAGLLVPSLVGVLFLCGCVQPVPQDTDRAIDPISVIEETGSSFIQSVLEDDEVSAAEFQEAKRRTIACLTDAGIAGADYVVMDSSGREGYTTADIEMTSEQIAADRKCHDKWMGGILARYNKQMYNPNDEDMEALTVSCLIHKKLVPEGFTVNDLRELDERQSVEWGPGETYEEALAKKPKAGTITDAGGTLWSVLPSGVAMNDPVVELCQNNPHKGLSE